MRRRSWPALAHAGVPVVVANPRPVRDVATATGPLAKTDCLDAHLLALFADRVRPEPRPLPDAARQPLDAHPRAFTTFRTESNEERPHQVLKGRPPAAPSHPSGRPYPEPLPAIDDPGHVLVTRIPTAGTFRVTHGRLCMANALKPHPIGLEAVDDGIWSISFGRVRLARLDERDSLIRD